MPALKVHLQEEWHRLERQGEQSAKRKRKLEEAKSQAPVDAETLADANRPPVPKKARTTQDETSPAEQAA